MLFVTGHRHYPSYLCKYRCLVIDVDDCDIDCGCRGQLRMTVVRSGHHKLGRLRSLVIQRLLHGDNACGGRESDIVSSLMLCMALPYNNCRWIIIIGRHKKLRVFISITVLHRVRLNFNISRPFSGGAGRKNVLLIFQHTLFNCIFIMTRVKNYIEEKNYRGLSPWKWWPSCDFRTLTKVHITLKPLVQMQWNVAHK